MRERLNWNLNLIGIRGAVLSQFHGVRSIVIKSGNDKVREVSDEDLNPWDKYDQSSRYGVVSWHIKKVNFFGNDNFQ